VNDIKRYRAKLKLKLCPSNMFRSCPKYQNDKNETETEHLNFQYRSNLYFLLLNIMNDFLIAVSDKFFNHK